jgi:Zn-dependent peptidase ImmA (M78 family)
MSWREAHEQAMFAAAEAHDRLEIDTEERIDVFAAIERIGLELVFRPLCGLSGLYVPAPRRAESGILVSANHPLARQRYTAAHELGHHWLGHDANLDLETERLARDAGAPLGLEEVAAEAFAAWFLMPPELVDRKLERLGISAPRHGEDLYGLALRLGTSYRATASHLPSLKLAELEAAQRWAAAPAKEAKVALSLGVEMASYRQDVWAISERDDDSTLEIGAGDRLVVRLPGGGSPEGRWRASSLPSEMELVADVDSAAGGADGRQLGLVPRDERQTLIVDLDAAAEGRLNLELVSEPAGGRAAPERFRLNLLVAQPLLGRARPASVSGSQAGAGGAPAGVGSSAPVDRSIPHASNGAPQ